MPEIGIPDRPNLVFILPDRLRRDSMACYGNDWIQSPHLNALAGQSFVFENAYVTQAVCAPSRSSILTGQYPPATGVTVNLKTLPPEVPTIAEMVSEEYRTGYIGRWHLGDELRHQHGFDEWVSCYDLNWRDYTNSEDRAKFSDYHHFLVELGFEPGLDHPGGKSFGLQMPDGLPPELRMASYLGGRAAEFIESCDGQPYVLYVSTLEPHPPYTGPYDDLYDPAALPVDETFLRFPDGASLFNRLRAEFFSNSVRDGIDLGSEEGWRRLRSNYWGNVRLVDGMVGTILEAIERSGSADRTAVVFTTDHGEMAGSHRMLEMRTPYEEASRVPLLMRVPWLQNGGSTVPGNISHIDLVPTVLDLLGQPAPEQLQGRSRAGVLKSTGTLADNDVFVQHNGFGDRDLTNESDSHCWPADKARELNYIGKLPWRSVITADRWKLTLCAGDQGELYDLNSDPSEIENLFDRPDHRDRIRLMAARLRLWQQEVGDTAPLPGV